MSSGLNDHACDYAFIALSTHATIGSFYQEILPQLEETLNQLLEQNIEWKIHSCLAVQMIKGEMLTKNFC